MRSVYDWYILTIREYKGSETARVKIQNEMVLGCVTIMEVTM